MLLTIPQCNERGVRVRLKTNDYKTMSECKISVGAENIWSITEWFTDTKYQHQGYGNYLMKTALHLLFKQLGSPNEIRYNWNGVNQYVMDWLTRNFDAVSIMPIAELKYAHNDTWKAHIFILNKDEVFKYYHNCHVLKDVDIVPLTQKETIT